MSRSRSRLAADWFAKLRVNAGTQAVEHDDVEVVDAATTTALAAKADTTYVNTAISNIDMTAKADVTYVNTAISNIPPSNNASALTTGTLPDGRFPAALPAISGAALTGVQPFPTGTKMVFAQASAPTGWTQDTSNNDKALRVVSGAGGGTGGTHAFSSPPSTAHSHTGPSHTHSTPNHSHSHSLSAGAHTLSIAQMPSHNHAGSITANITNSGDYYTSWRKFRGGYTPPSTYTGSSHGSHYQSTSRTSSSYVFSQGGGGSHSHSLAGSITSGGSGTSGAGGTGATSSAGPTAFAPQYVDVIVATKD